jgi:integrase
VRARGTGYVFQPTYRDKTTGTARKVATWYLRWRDGRKQVREATKAKTKAEAEKILRQRLTARDQGRPTGPAVERTTFEDLAKLIVTDYKVNERKSTDDLEGRIVHLREFFGGWRATAIDAGQIDAYKAHRLAEKAKPATINRELACLRRMFRLGGRSGRVTHKLEVTLLAENNRRRGFFEREEHDTVVGHLPEDAGDVAEYLYWTGWRKAEALALQWPQVDLAAGVIRIEDTKSGEPRTLPYGRLPVLIELIHKRRRITDTVQQANGVIVPWVFHRGGKPVRHFRRSWVSACVAAGLGHEVRDKDGKLVKKIAHRIPHDYRRSAARNLSRAGVPEQVIMALCGWKTRSVFDRYRIVAERDLAEGLAKLAGTTYEMDAPAHEAKVVTMTGGARTGRRA